MKMLVVIPARGGSKGLLRKNIKEFAGKPLICHSIDVAREIVQDVDICVSTDDFEIKEIVEKYGLFVPFIRPAVLASDTASTNDVLLHAIDYYKGKGIYYDTILLLQPTSPLRLVKHLKDAILCYNNQIDMVVSVKQSHSASVICNEDEEGFLKLTLSKGDRRQDNKPYYEYNGALYVINVNILSEFGLAGMTKIVKYVMPDEYSIDIDNQLDWDIAEYLYRRAFI